MKNDGVPSIWVGMPAVLKLEEFGSQVWSAFGHPPFLCGSATVKRDFRDVDVRLILPDEEYEQHGYGHPHEMTTNAKWAAMCWAFSALGQDMTGLPIDFQIQQMTDANKRFPRDKDNSLVNARIPLGQVSLRFSRARK